MKRHLRIVFVTLLMATAALMIAAVLLFRAAHLGFYDSRQAQAKFGVSQSDLALVRAGQPTYVWVLPGGGHILNGLHRSKILIGVVYVPALLIVLYEVRRLARHRRYEAQQITSRQSL